MLAATASHVSVREKKKRNAINKYLNSAWESRRAAWHFMFSTIRFGSCGEDQSAGLGANKLLNRWLITWLTYKDKRAASCSRPRAFRVIAELSRDCAVGGGLFALIYIWFLLRHPSLHPSLHRRSLRPRGGRFRWRLQPFPAAQHGAVCRRRGGKFL